MSSIIEFQGKHRFLSNFWMCPVHMLDGIRYPSAEHAYQAHKVLNLEQRRSCAAIELPGNVKRWGRTIKLRHDWEQIKFEVMLEVVRRKFQQNLAEREMLLDTNDMYLEEGNRWGDRIWGVSPPGSGKGQNQLGIILMKVRAELRKDRP